MRASKQIHIYLSEPEKAEFERYARKYLLDGAGLMALLFARELRVGRLDALVEEFLPPDGPRKSKVTFRTSEKVHHSLSEHSGEHGCVLSLAGATLVRAEAQERWLEASVTTRNESPIS